MPARPNFPRWPHRLRRRAEIFNRPGPISRRRREVCRAAPEVPAPRANFAAARPKFMRAGWPFREQERKSVHQPGVFALRLRVRDRRWKRRGRAADRRTAFAQRHPHRRCRDAQKTDGGRAARPSSNPFRRGNLVGHEEVPPPPPARRSETDGGRLQTGPTEGRGLQPASASGRRRRWDKRARPCLRPLKRPEGRAPPWGTGWHPSADCFRAGNIRRQEDEPPPPPARRSKMDGGPVSNRSHGGAEKMRRAALWDCAGRGGGDESAGKESPP